MLKRFHFICLVSLFFSGNFLYISQAQSLSASRQQTLSPTNQVDIQNQFVQQHTLQSLSGWITLTVTYKDQASTYEGAFLLRSPNQMHLEILDDLGQAQVRVIANGKKVYWWSAKKNKSKILKQNQKVLKKIFKLPLKVDDLLTVLLQQNFSQKLQRIYMQADSPGLLFLQFPKKVMELNAEDLKIKHLKVFKKKKQKKVLYEIDYQWIEVTENLKNKQYPKKLTWNFYKPKVKVEFEFKDIELNPNLTQEKFDFSGWSSK